MKILTIILGLSLNSLIFSQTIETSSRWSFESCSDGVTSTPSVLSFVETEEGIEFTQSLSGGTKQVRKYKFSKEPQAQILETQRTAGSNVLSRTVITKIVDGQFIIATSWTPKEAKAEDFVSSAITKYEIFGDGKLSEKSVMMGFSQGQFWVKESETCYYKQQI